METIIVLVLLLQPTPAQEIARLDALCAVRVAEQQAPHRPGLRRISWYDPCADAQRARAELSAEE